MSLTVVLAIGISMFFAINIGASGAAATMGAAYGSGAIRFRWMALSLAAIGIFLGAVIGSGEVVKTISQGIVPADLVSIGVAMIILSSATITLFIANLLGIPLSTSEVTVGSIVGVGIALQALYVKNLLYIVSFWFATPFVAFLIALALGKLIVNLEDRFPQLMNDGKWKRWMIMLLILTGMAEAFSAGMNNVANAIGPIVGAGIMSSNAGILLGAACVALGALFLGGKVLETNGKKITSLSLLQGSCVSGTGAMLVIISSILGVPVPLTQITTSAILGIGTAKNGFQLWQKNIIIQIIKVWVVSPVLSLVISFALMNAFMQPNLYIIIVMVSVFIATVGSISLYHTVRKEKSSYHDEGGGI